MGEIATMVKTQKRRMRKQAIARRKSVSEVERAEAGKQLANIAAQALGWSYAKPTIKSATKTTVNMESAIGANRVSKFATQQPIEALNGEAMDSDTAMTQERPTASADTRNGQTQKAKKILLHSGDTIAAYVSMGTEVPTLPLLNELVEHGLRVLVPRLGHGRDIGWSEYRGLRTLRNMPRTASGGLRPSEPESEILGADAIAEARLALIPAFAIDLDGTRLGRGGGWYDRALGCCHPGTLKIGVCWNWEFINNHGAVPRESHDIPVDAVLTSKRIVWN